MTKVILKLEDIPTVQVLCHGPGRPPVRFSRLLHQYAFVSIARLEKMDRIAERQTATIKALIEEVKGMRELIATQYLTNEGQDDRIRVLQNQVKFLECRIPR